VTAAEPSPGTGTGTSAPNKITINASCQKNALVVRVDPSGAAPAWSGTEPMSIVGDAKTWVDKVSYNNAVFNAIPRVGAANAPVVLAQPFSFYNSTSQTPIDSLVQEVIDKLVAAKADELTNIKHLLLFLNTTTPTDVGPAGYWAVKKMVYRVGATTKEFSVSINPRNPNWKQVAHAIGHQFGLVDLSQFDPATNKILNQDITPIGFDIMAIPANLSLQPDISALANVHPLQESKFALTNPKWIDLPNVNFIARPAAAIATTTQVIKAASNLTSSSDKIAIALGLSGKADLTAERYYAWIEARPFAPGKDSVGAGSGFDGVVVYYSTKDITAGVGRAKWYELNPALPLKFTYTVGGTQERKIGTSGWSIKSLTKVGDNYNVELAYTPPTGVYGAYVQNGTSAHPWLSPDIRTEIPGCEGTACAVTSGDNAGLIAGDVDTRVYGTVHNNGAASADVILKFSIYRTNVTGIGTLEKTEFASVYTTIPPKTGAGDGKVEVFGILNLKFLEGTSWGPDLIAALNAHTSHYCLFIDIIPVTPGDDPGLNKTAQKNSGFVEHSHASPYPPLDYSFYISNTDNVNRMIFFDVKNAPSSWNITLSPSHVSLAAHAEQKVNMHITMPANFPDCTDFPVQISASILNDHTLVPMSGIMPYLKLRKKESMTVTGSSKNCYPDSLLQKYSNAAPVKGLSTSEGGNIAYNKNNYGQLMAYYLKEFLGRDANVKRGCATIYVYGCTNPAQANTAVTIMYQDPAGNPIFKQVMTDSVGCYTDEHVVVEGGDWKTTAMFNGDACYSAASASNTVHVALPITGDQDGDGLKDVDEFQGDEDHDGIPDQLDPDSDNDGIKDGDEPKGNCDCDSYANVIDYDSDNDGIPDGKDPTPYGTYPQYKTFFSAMYHRFDFDSKLPIDDGSGFNVRAGVNLTSRWGIEAEVGVTSTDDSLKKSGTVYNLNLNALYYLTNKPVVYLTAGAGALLFNGFTTSSNTFAVNGGAGIMVPPIASKPAFVVRAEVKAHYGFAGYGTNGNLNIQYSLGLAYRIRIKSTPCKMDKIIKQHASANKNR
jgi:hypothetical protein